MLNFANDYARSAHPAILAKLQATNLLPMAGYGFDEYTDCAKQKIKAICQCPDAEVHFLIGGTQTNLTIIKAMLAPYQGVLSADTGHINVHEAGAIEATGHKVLTLPHQHGKITARQIEDYLNGFYQDSSHRHKVFPGMVYISHPTEYGTLYRQAELRQISQVCKAFDIPLMLDGARLAYGLAAETDVDLATIAQWCDVFYFGGTKAGLLFGEAVVFSTPQFIPKQFHTIVKQQGALLAKGYLLGIQFDTMFSDGLYQTIGKQAVQHAQHIAQTLRQKGYSLLLTSPTNQQFVILTHQQYEQLSKQVQFAFWDTYDDKRAIFRIATDWATTEQAVEQLLALL